ncbi:MAG: arylsulfatase [Verrucomicrobiales bacterium]|nr:arylsulfatase [Verrucomicrobiales bacterium]|tara:strand:+ start:335 stop:1741 length:1407 start_codon:yes stop_codon:yes gene_type:complete
MTFLRSIALTVLLTLPAAAAKLPNIIYIMADDLGYAELGSYGQKKIRTPHLDMFANEGMRFTQHYTSAPVCAPARCSLMTGKHGGHAYVRTNYEIGAWETHRGQLPIRDKDVTIAELLKERGYATGAFGKWGLGEVGSSGDPLKQGFDRFFGYNCQRHAHNLFPKYLVDDSKRLTLKGNTRGLTGETYGPQAIADEMLKFVHANKDKPFFVYYPTVIPHLALQAPQNDIDAYKGEWPETPYTGKSYLPHPTPRSAYAAMITFMDRQIGRLMALLKELNLDDNTIVFFTSDNGTTFLKGQVDFEFFNSVNGLRGLKGSVHEGGIRVPLLVRWPGKIKAGSVSHHASAHYDAMATICDIVGIKPAKNTDGISYLRALLGKKQKKHDYLFWDFAGYGGQVAIRQGNWKAVKKNLRKNPDAKLELYNLKSDHAESKDLATEKPDIARRMERIMLDARVTPVIKRFRFGAYGK